MSIISRTNPLNLQYRVCLVTSASTPLGVIICKTLLKANALVLGIDSRPKDDSLNAGLGTHFQFERCGVNDERAAERILEAAKEGFAFERVDVLVNVMEEAKEDELQGLQRLGEAVRQFMEQEGKGSIINVVDDVQGTKLKSAIDFTKDFAPQKDEHGVRCNLIVPRATTSEEKQQSSSVYGDARAHMTDLMKTERIAKDVPSASESRQSAAKLYDIANLTLFLAGDMSEGVAGQVVCLDGSCRAL